MNGMTSANEKTHSKTSSKTIEVEMHYELPASVDKVFTFLADPENDAKWQSSCDTVQLNNPQEPVQAGSQYTIGFSFLSRKMSFQAEVTQYEKNHRYGYRSLDGPMSYEGGYEFRETATGTSVYWFFHSMPGKFFGIIPHALIKKTLLKKVGEDVEKLKSAFAEEQQTAALANAV